MKISALIAVLVVGFAVYLALQLDIGTTVHPHHDSECFLVGGKVFVGGSEDITVYKNNRLLVSGGDLDKLLCHANRTIRPGGVYSVNLDTLSVTLIPVISAPKGFKMQPHGIFYSNASQLVYVVSHHEILDDQIVVLKLDEYASGELTFTFKAALSSPLFGRGTLNDIIEGKPGEFYVTEWIAEPLPEGGQKHLHGVKKVMHTIQQLSALFVPRTGVFRCTWDQRHPERQATCSKELDGYYMANGIATNPERSEVYVVDAVGRTIHFYRRLSSGSLQEFYKLKVTPSLDNIEYDYGTGKLTVGTIPLAYKELQRIDGDINANGPGGMLVLTRRGDTFEAEDYLIHSGSIITGIASAIFAGDWVALGGCCDNGVLVCPVR